MKTGTGKRKYGALAAAVAISVAAGAQQAATRDAFLLKQAYEHVQRISGQMDVLETNQGALAGRLERLEHGGGEVKALKAEIDALKAEIARLRRDMADQRREIVADILAKIKQATPPPAPPSREPARGPRDAGPREEYTVQPGDTLSLIAQAFNTTVGRLKEMNNLKSDRLSIGQRLMVPAQQPQKQDKPHPHGERGR